ncbi:aspartyl protease family protein [Litoribacter ruber]|uniref:aspartyl protease family protein n=1 Tax=Litoribacter ruber TaxID=702568 RepID=UPI001BDB31D9|nr:aspartyl protease family protein [Litoribacter ruber]MBT0812077.1 aspartyl protease family protein [Litoribacter ruber]
MIKPRLLYIIFLLFFAFESFGQVPGFFMEEEQNRVEMQFISNNNLIILPASINGGPKLNFLIDTGVKSNLLFSKTIGDQLDLFYSRKINLMGADGKTVLSASISPNNEIQMDGVVGRVQALLVLDEDFVELERVVGIPIHGVIGHEFFKLNPVRVDYDNNILTFFRENRFRRKPFGYKRMKMTLENGKPYVTSIIRQSPGPTLQAKLLIDTGANHGLLLNQETSEEIVLPERTLESDLGTSLGGDLTGEVGRVRKLTVGRLRFNDIITSYPDETQFSDIIIETGRLGSLGSDVLSRAIIIYDYPQERLYYKRGRAYRQPFEFDMSGLTIRMPMIAEKRFFIEQIRSDSPAERSGFKVGDEIVAVNGIPVEFWNLPDVTELLRSRDGRRVKVEVHRIIKDAKVNLVKDLRLERQI